MKSCQNIEQFFEKMQALGGEMGKANHLLMNEISKDLASTHSHIKQQQEALEANMDVFKQCVFKLAILWKIQRLTVGYTRRGSIRTRFNQDQDNEYQAAGSLTEETRLLDPNTVHIKYSGGVISTHDLPSFRRFIIRVTRC